MKTFNVILALAIFLISSVAWTGGVGVGNARKAYKSPYGFTVSYPEKLALEVHSKDSFEINNTDLVKSPAEESKVEFRVSKGEVNSFEELLPFAQKENPELSFAPFNLDGARGYFHESKGIDRLDGVYYLITGNYELVRIRVHAFAAGNGLEWIAPIVRTFSYDDTAPLLLNFRANPIWRAGQTERIYFQLRDVGSGVADSLYFDLWVKGGPAIGPPDRQLRGFFPLHAADSDWYYVDVPLSPLQVPGRFQLGTIWYFDNAGNRFFNINDNGLFHLDNGQKMPALNIEIVNTGSYDMDPPVMKEFAASANWEAGKPATLYFRAEDRTGLKLPAAGGGDCSIRFDHRDNGEWLYVCGTVRLASEKGKNWYAVDFKLNPFLLAGVYELKDVRIFDNLDNELNMSAGENGDYLEGKDLDTRKQKVKSISVRVKNKGPADTQEPEILGLRVDGPWRAGSVGSLLLHAKDDVSGIENFFKRGAYFIGEGSDFVISEVSVTPLGKDWYSVSIPVPNRKAGIYYLQQLEVFDKAGHSAQVWCDQEGRLVD